MQKLVPCLWFDDRIEEAAQFYVSVFPDAKITTTSRYGDAGPLPKGKVLTLMFELAGQEFMALNGGPQFQFSEAVSFVVRCETQAEVDHYWSGLTAGGGEERACGWLKDQFGLSWQIVPNVMMRYITDRDPKRVERVMQAMFRMKKLDIAGLDRAYAGKP